MEDTESRVSPALKAWLVFAAICILLAIWKPMAKQWAAPSGDLSCPPSQQVNSNK